MKLNSCFLLNRCCVSGFYFSFRQVIKIFLIFVFLTSRFYEKYFIKSSL